MVRVTAASAFVSIRQPSMRRRSSRSCRASTGVGAVDMRSTAWAVFGNAMTSRMDGSPARSSDQAVQAERDAAVRRRAVLERVEEEAEPQLRVLVADAEQRKIALLKRRVVDTDAAAADLDAVEHDVVRLREHLAGFSSSTVHVLSTRRGERVVHGDPPLLLLVPLEEREVGHPQ